MATRKTTPETPQNNDNDEAAIIRNMAAEAASGEWNVVVEEEPLQVMLAVGDAFVGEYTGEYLIPDPAGGDPFKYVRFRFDGRPYAISAGYKLAEAFEKIPVGSICRITLIKEIDLGTGRNPMKDYEVAIRP